MTKTPVLNHMGPLVKALIMNQNQEEPLRVAPYTLTMKDREIHVRTLETR